MRDKIYRNREVLRGLTFDVKLNGRIYQFKIFYVNEDKIKVAIPISYREMSFDDSDSLPSIVKEVILDNSSNNTKPLYRQAYLSKHKLKKVPVIIDGVKFNFDNITNSNVLLVKFIEYDELLDSNAVSFVVKLRSVIEANLLENPPKVRKSYSSYSSFGTLPYLFESGGSNMYFQSVGNVKKVISDEKLEESRKKHKKLAEEEKKKREKMEKLEKELGLDKPSKTRNMDHFRY